MSKIIQIKESDLINILETLISEQSEMGDEIASNDDYQTSEITFKVTYTNRFENIQPLDVDALGKRIANHLNDKNIIIGGNKIIDFDFITPIEV